MKNILVITVGLGSFANQAMAREILESKTRVFCADRSHQIFQIDELTVKDYDARIGEDLIQIIQKITYVPNNGPRFETNVYSQFQLANGATYFDWSNSYNEFVHFYAYGQNTVVNFQFENASSNGSLTQFSCTLQ